MKAGCVTDLGFAQLRTWRVELTPLHGVDWRCNGGVRSGGTSDQRFWGQLLRRAQRRPTQLRPGRKWCGEDMRGLWGDAIQWAATVSISYPWRAINQLAPSKHTRAPSLSRSACAICKAYITCPGTATAQQGKALTDLVLPGRPSLSWSFQLQRRMRNYSCSSCNAHEVPLQHMAT